MEESQYWVNFFSAEQSESPESPVATEDWNTFFGGEPEPSDDQGSYIPDLSTIGALGRGVAEGLSTELPSLAGGALSFITPDILKEQGFDPGKDISDWADEKADEWFGSQDYQGIDRIVYEGSKMLAPSVIPGGVAFTGAKTLLKIGKITKAAKAAEIAGDAVKAAELWKDVNKASKLALTIGSVAPAAMFGLSQAQQTEDFANERADELESQGRTDEAADVRAKGQGIAPYLSGGIEAVGEFYGTKYLGKLFKLDEAQVVRRGATQIVKDFLKTLGVEVGTEIGQAAGEAQVEKSFDIRPDADPWAEALDVIGPTAFMTLLTGGIGGAANMAISEEYAQPAEDAELTEEELADIEDIKAFGEEPVKPTPEAETTDIAPEAEGVEAEELVKPVEEVEDEAELQEVRKEAPTKPVEVAGVEKVAVAEVEDIVPEEGLTVDEKVLKVTPMETIKKRLRNAQKLLSPSAKRRFSSMTFDETGEALVSKDGLDRLKFYRKGETTIDGDVIQGTDGSVVVEVKFTKERKFKQATEAPIEPVVEPKPKPVPTIVKPEKVEPVAPVEVSEGKKAKAKEPVAPKKPVPEAKGRVEPWEMTKDEFASHTLALKSMLDEFRTVDAEHQRYVRSRDPGKTRIKNKLAGRMKELRKEIRTKYPWMVEDGVMKETIPKHEQIVQQAKPAAKVETKVEKGEKGDVELSTVEKVVGKTWDSKGGKRTIVKKAEGRPEGWLEISTEGQKHRNFIHVSDVESEITFDTKNFKSYQKALKESTETKAKEDKVKAEREDLDGFDSGMKAMGRGRAIKTLSANVKHKGRVISRRNLIRELVKEGRTINNKGQLIKADGSFLDARDLTKTGIDYAKYLISKKVELATTEPSKPSPRKIDLKTVKSLPIFQRGTVAQSDNGDITVNFPNNRGLIIKNVDTMENGDILVETAYGRPLKSGEKVTGSYTHVEKAIRIVKGVGDKHTVNHEFVHFLEKSGLLTKSEIAAIERQAVSYNKGKFSGEEGRVRWLTSELEKREKGRESIIGQIVQKIADIIDSFANLAGITARGVVRGVESGKTATRTIDQLKKMHKGKVEVDEDILSELNEFAQPTSLSTKSAIKNIFDNLNFKKWFGKSKVVDEKGKPLVVYHGTNAEIEIFSGNLIWFTPNPRVAGKYADRAAFRDGAFQEMEDEDGEFTYTDVDEVSESDMLAGAEGQNVLPVYLSLKNPVDLSEWGTTPSAEEFFEYLKEIGIAGKGEEFADWANDLSVDEPTIWKIIEDWNLEQDFKKAGYDGLIIDDVVTSGEGHVAYAVFEPIQVKSVFNRGTFSETDPRISFSTKERELSANARKYLEKNYPEKLAQYDKHFKPSDVDIAETKPSKPSKPVKQKGWKKRLFGVDKKGTITKAVEFIDDTRKNWRTRVFDRLHPVKDQLGNEAYMLHRLETGIEGVLATFMRHGILKWDGKAMTVDTNRKGFLEWFGSLKEDGDNLLYWIAAKRAEVLSTQPVSEERSKENWLLKAERDEIFEAVGEKPNNAESWDVLHEQFNEFNNGILDLAVESGLINQERRKQWEQHFYVPFYRVFEDPASREEYLRGPAQSKKNIDANIRRLMGSDKKLGDPLENVIRNWTHLIHESMRNVARSEAFDSAKRLNLDVIQEMEMKDLVNVLGTKTEERWAVKKEGGKRASKTFETKKEANDYAGVLTGTTGNKYDVSKTKIQQTMFGRLSDHNILTFQRDGDRVYFRVNDPELFNALSNVNNEAFDNALMKMFRLSKKALTFGATFGPAFRISNFARDTVHTALISKSFVPFFDSVKGFYSAMKEDQDFVKFAASGAAFGSSYVKADDAHILAQFIKRTTKREGKGVADRILDTPRKLLSFWEKVGSASENAARVTLYKTRIKEQKSHLEAAFESRDLLDFTMRGDAASIQFLAQVVPFMNARMQGGYKLGRAAWADPILFGVKGATLAMASLALWGFNKDREEWKALEDWDKWTYYHVWIGEDHYRIPKPFEVGAIFSTAFEATAETMSDNEEIGFMVDMLQHTFSETFALNPVPQLMRPVIEQWANKSFFTGRPIESTYLQGLSPGERADQWTSKTLQLAGKWGIPPKRAEALIEGYFSTVGTFILSGADMMAYHFGDFPEDPTKSIQDYPMLGRFIRETKIQRNTKYSSRFYAAMKEMDELIGTVNHYKKTRDFDKARKLRHDNIKKIRFKPTLNKYRIRLRDLNKKIRRVYSSKTMSPEDKRSKLNKYTVQRNALTKKAYEIILKSKK